MAHGRLNILEGVKPADTDLEGYGFADWGGVDRIGKVWEGFEADPEITSEAVLWLDGKGKQLNAEGKSFFLAVNFVNPHDIMNYDNTGFKSNYLSSGASRKARYMKKHMPIRFPPHGISMPMHRMCRTRCAIIRRIGE